MSTIAPRISSIIRTSGCGSTAPRMRSPVAELLAAAAAALEDAGVRWYLFGAQAALLYGAARLTADVDVTVRLEADIDTAGLVDIFRSYGFEPRFEAAAFIERTRVVPLVHQRTSVPLDIVVAGPGLEDLFLERVRIHEVEGVQIPVASPEDLVVMKILAGREKDADDVRAILAAQGARLDAGYVRETLTSLETALGQSDLRPAFDLALRRAAI